MLALRILGLWCRFGYADTRTPWFFADFLRLYRMLIPSYVFIGTLRTRSMSIVVTATWHDVASAGDGRDPLYTCRMSRSWHIISILCVDGRSVILVIRLLSIAGISRHLLHRVSCTVKNPRSSDPFFLSIETFETQGCKTIATFFYTWLEF